MRSIAHPAALTFARIHTRTLVKSTTSPFLPPSFALSLSFCLASIQKVHSSLWAPSLRDQSAKQTPPLKKRSLTEHGLPVHSPKLAPAPAPTYTYVATSGSTIPFYLTTHSH
ncbi:hypothetical protein NXS19_012464 [Fusarium pseudograminearum]|nr:hypothetical protein NXS19_012464 [Fusarium pseudograminearum]